MPWNNLFGHYEDTLLSLLITNKSPCVVIWELAGGAEKSFRIVMNLQGRKLWKVATPSSLLGLSSSSVKWG